MSRLDELQKVGIVATGTLHVNRKGIPDSAVKMKAALDKSDLPRGVSYYVREDKSPLVHV